MSDYSLITHGLPSRISVNGKECPIDTRTCKALQAYLIMEDDDVPQETRAVVLVQTMLQNPRQLKSDEYGEALERISEYLNGFPTKKSAKESKPILSYEQDHALIVAAFRQAYGISLEQLKALHWWEFLALLGGLPEDTRISEVMKVRYMPINSKDSPEVRQAKIKAKQAVALAPKKRKNGKSGMDIISQALDAEGF